MKSIEDRVTDLFRDAFRKKIRIVLDENESLCMDNEDDKSCLLNALINGLWPYQTNNKDDD